MRRPRAGLFSAVIGALAFASTSFAAQFTLTWRDNSTNESGFRIERATGTTGAFSLIATTGANVTSYVDANLPASTYYRYRLRAFNAAGNSGYSNTASGTTPSSATNTAPTLSTFSNRTISEDGSTGSIAFTVGDSQTSAGSLAVSGSSSNTTLVPNANITFGGSGSSRTVTVRPAANRSGSATITVRVSDGSLSTSRTFTVTVSAVNDTPTISNIADRTVVSGTSSGSIGFTIGDAETSTSSLTMAASSSNQTLLPNSRLSLGGSGSSRTLSFTPQAGTSGSVTVTVRVSDGSLSATDTFVVNVTSSSTSNTAPTISSIADRTISMNGTSGTIAFTIGDSQTSASSLVLTKNASNKTLVPLSNITLGGTGSNRTVTIRPVSNTTGWSTIWIEVSDGKLTRTESFVVNVSPALTFTDIGSPAIKGSHTWNGSKVSVRAGGTDIWGGSDQFRYGYQSIPGDAELTVRLSSLTKSHDWAKAGLMFRASTAANAAYVFVCLTPSNSVALQYRTSTGAAAAQIHTETSSVPKWLKLSRTGDTFYAYHSGDGVTWNFVDSITVDLPGTTPAGIAVTSHAATTATTAVFEMFSVD